MLTRPKEGGIRSRLSKLLGNSKDIAIGSYACGGTLDADTTLPRIKLKQNPAGGGCLSLPITTSESGRLKAALVSAGQEPELNAQGAIERRFPWAARPDLDFRVFNSVAWKNVVTRVIRKVGFPHLHE